MTAMLSADTVCRCRLLKNVEAVCGFSSQPWCFSFLRSCQCKCSRLLQNGVQLCGRNFGSAIKINAGGRVHNPSLITCFKKKKARGKERDLEEFLICWNIHRTRTPSFPCARKICWGAFCDRHFSTEVFLVMCSLCKLCVMTWLRKIFGILRRLTYLDCGELMVLVSGFYLLIFFFLRGVSGWHRHQNPWGYIKTHVAANQGKLVCACF